MGLSIHYNGRISDKQLLPEMIAELEEISKVHGWKCIIFERKFPEEISSANEHDGKLYGLCFVPPGSEPVSVSFLSNGRMCGPMELQCWGESTDETERKYLYMISVKTQYAGAEVHKMVIHIFKYLNKRYLSDFKMSDEGEYWETNDEALLDANFKRYTFLIDSFVSALENNKRNEGEDMEQYIHRMMKNIKDKLKPED